MRVRGMLRREEEGEEEKRGVSRGAAAPSPHQFDLSPLTTPEINHQLLFLLAFIRLHLD